MRRSLLVSGIVLFACLFGISTTADASTAAPDSLRNQAPNIYIDCDDCDYDYLREEIGFVNFVRDRKEAEIHLLVTKQQTGSGGDEYTVEFIGREHFDGMVDTLSFSCLDSDSDDTIRKVMARTFKLGLMRFVAHTPLAEHVSISYDQPTETKEVADKWNYWVFEISGNSWINADDTYHNINFWGNITAKRVTEASKLQLRYNASYNEQQYEYELFKEVVTDGDTTTITVPAKDLYLRRSYGFNWYWFLSINDHWSAGLSGGEYSSTYSNKDIQIDGGPLVEYNIFPYSESNRRQLRVIYKLEVNYTDYSVITTAGWRHSWLYEQSLGAELELIQPWGSISSELWGSTYLHDMKKNRLSWSNRLSLRLVKGLSFNLSGSYSRIRDQVAIADEDAVQADYLVRQREFEQKYYYYVSAGISYSFGSIYNNVVNPRFGN